MHKMLRMPELWPLYRFSQPHHCPRKAFVIQAWAPARWGRGALASQNFEYIHAQLILKNILNN